MLILLIICFAFSHYCSTECLMKFNFKEKNNPKEMDKCLKHKEEKIVSITQFSMLSYSVHTAYMYCQCGMREDSFTFYTVESEPLIEFTMFSEEVECRKTEEKQNLRLGQMQVIFTVIVIISYL